ncbi:LuxR C-terminal-related transcriptional regulator [Ruminococcaceae bacterium OttesenSCG-928-D13]|nr:LuxR C-terminal-related transcriptional regulator [Ruminococcaceae bacterium OttesenSCG-928-D13]
MQDLNFLNDKFTPAALPEVCAPRQALLAAFHQALAGRFLYVGAPAGSGKTVSVQLWLNACGRKAVWIGLDRYDNAPSVFYKQLATGLYSTQPRNAGMRVVLSSDDFAATPVEHTVRLISAMYPDEGRYALVLDDMHLVDNREIRKALPQVLRRLPHGFVTLVLSRHEIPEELAPLAGEQAVLAPEALRFSEDEIRDYFVSLGRTLTEQEGRSAYQATEGWAIGVNAIAQSGQLEPDRARQGFARYFETQIWEKWDESLQTFCLSTAVADAFDAELAAALSGRADAPQVMEQLVRTNSFLSRLHADTYRYHHLFLDFLRERLNTGEMDTARIYKQAARYYKEKKDYSRALRFSLASGDYKGIDTYLYLFLFENHKGIVGDYADFLRTFFVADFPEKAFAALPALHILCAWYNYITSHHRDFEAHMDAVYKNLPRIALGDSKFVEYAILAYSVDHRTTMREKVRQFKSFGRYVKRFTGDGLATRIPSFSHNMPYMHRSNLDYSDLALDEDSVEKLDKTFAVLLGAEWNYIRHGIVACFSYERNRLPLALEQNSRALDAYDPGENKAEGLICLLVLQHSILWRMGSHDQASRVLARLEDVVQDSAQFFVPNMAAYRARLRLYDGDAAAAREWLGNYFVVDTEHIELFRSFQHFTTARAHMVLGDAEVALHCLELLRDFGQNVNRPVDEAEARCLLAVLHWAQGEKKQAASELEAALGILQPFDYIRPVADEGSAILPVLRRVLAEVGRPGYSGGLNRAYVNEAVLAAHAFGKVHKGVAAGLGSREKPVKLSKQQRRMLELLSQGYRQAEICALTGLGIPTIKTHTSLAYRKLGVNNAMDAVLKAREMGLIETGAEL